MSIINCHPELDEGLTQRCEDAKKKIIKQSKYMEKENAINIFYNIDYIFGTQTTFTLPHFHTSTRS